MTIFLADPDSLLSVFAVSVMFALMAAATALSATRSSRRSILHFGHLPRLVDLTSGCIGQTKDLTCFVVVFFSEIWSRNPALANACIPIPASIMTVRTNGVQSANCLFISFMLQAFFLLLDRLQGQVRQINVTNTHRSRFDVNHVNTSLRNVEVDFVDALPD